MATHRDEASLAKRLETALSLHAGGRLDEAEVLYHEILRESPRHFEALHWLATVFLQRGHFDSALEGFDQALALDPDHAASLNNRSVALYHLRRFDEALKSCERALEINPDYAEAFYNHGNALRGLRRMEDALKSYDRACGVRPDYAQAFCDRGVVLRELRRLDEAVQSYDRAIAIWPEYVEAYGNRGVALLDLGRLDEALESCDRALGIRPDLPSICNVRGIVLRELKRPVEALRSYDHALGIRPEDVLTLNNRGIALRDLGRLDEALECYERALLIKPGYADALSNRGNALRDLNRLEQALQCFERALLIEPNHADAHWNRSLCRLLMGELALGWQEYEWRWQVEPQKSNQRGLTQPLWLGREDLRGKTILLHAEQGLGDTLQFCRYATQVAQLGATVILEVQSPLKTLLQRLEGVALVLAQGEGLPEFDCHCPLLSLPLALGADLGNTANGPYLKGDPHKAAAWKARLSGKGRRRIGLAWSGAAAHENDRRRSIALRQFRTLIDERADYYCLQTEVKAADREVLEETREILSFRDEIKDFSDTAALIEAMDLVITVDTSLAHLAGAMGREAWILLPYSPDWRWLLGRTDSPWYRSARLFRQSGIGDWDGVLHQVKTLANAFLGTYSKQPEQTMARSGSPRVPPGRPVALDTAARMRAAFALHQQGELDLAQDVYKEVLQAEPRHFDALQLLATIATQQNDSETALALFGRALTIRPDHAVALNNRGNALRNLGRIEEALTSYARALRSKPDYVEALNNRGLALRQLRRVGEALASYEHALKIDSQHAEVLYNRGEALRELGRFDQAVNSFTMALAITPAYAAAFYSRGMALQDLDRMEEALADFECSLALRPDDADAHNNRGIVLEELQRLDEALECYERALAIKTAHVPALPREPNDARIHWNRSLCWLLKGEYALGWREYEWRWQVEPQKSNQPGFTQPLWLGREDLRDKTILLHAEQGLGDTLQFCRYATQVAQLGARVILEVQSPLKTLLQRLEGVALVLAQGEDLPEFDYHCPLLSLPLALGADLGNIANLPYLKGDPHKAAAWKTRLGGKGRRRIGLAWSGAAANENDRRRSIALEQFKTLIDERADYYCLQTEVKPADREVLEGTRGIQSFREEIKDFSDTAALIEAMDLVITVDTSLAHLAGAMGREAWILLPYSPDWRWLLGRTDSPWYRSARLFRQSSIGNWDGVLADVAQALG